MPAGVGQAQDYPSRAVRVIVPYPAGGATDIVARVMQEWLMRKWSQPVVIDNRSGAAGNIGTEAAFKSEPDGYTVLVNAPSPMTVNQSLYAKLNFEPSEFVPVSILTVIPIGLIINPRRFPPTRWPSSSPTRAPTRARSTRPRRAPVRPPI